MPILATGFTSGGTYSYTGTGLSLNASTGEINLATSTAGTYQVVYTVVANASICQVGSVSNPISITINNVITPVVTFNYSSPVCPDDNDQLPSLGTGFTTGGTFSSTSGLSINSSTGEIDVQASTPGTYTITYSVAANSATCQVANSGPASFTINNSFEVIATGECVGPIFMLSANPVNNSFDPVTATYDWENASGISVGTTRTLQATSIGNYTVTVTSNGCSSTSAAFNVESIACVIQKGISVNGDGLNDNFELTGFDVKKLTLFNRFGMKVYSRNNYTNQWFGQSDKGDELPDATYYYVIERNNGEATTGWIYLNRAQ